MTAGYSGYVQFHVSYRTVQNAINLTFRNLKQIEQSFGSKEKCAASRGFLATAAALVNFTWLSDVRPVISQLLIQS